jgi:hypothetical protein
VEVRGGYVAAGEDISETTRKGRFNADGTVSSLYQAILSGDIDVAGVATDDAYHVVLAVNIPANSGTALDGLTISGGTADSNTYIPSITVTVQIDHNRGGGIYNRDASPTLTNLTISGNTATDFGSGMYNHDAAPTLANVTINNNTTTGDGGGMYNYASSPVLTGVTINNNTTTGDGGGMYNASSSPVLINITIAGNKAIGGGGIYNNASSSPVLTNVTIAGNKATGNNGGGGIYNNDNSSNPNIKNSIIWGNVAGTLSPSGIEGFGTPVISYSIVEGNTDTSNGNMILGSSLTDSPFTNWIDPSISMPVGTPDYRLNGSSAIDAGENDDYPNDASDIATLQGVPLTNFSAATQAAINAALATDLGGNPRKVDGNSDSEVKIDMGAYEKQ